MLKMTYKKKGQNCTAFFLLIGGGGGD